MRLTRLSLENFRNYQKTEVAINRDLVLILGQNATGKTNLLEAVYFLSQLKSFRSPDSFLAKSGEDHFRIIAIAHPSPSSLRQAREGDPLSKRVTLWPKDVTYEAVVQVNPALKRSFKINGQRVKRGVWKGFAVVLFIPNDLNLFSMGPGLRRRYLDDTLSQASKNYALDLMSLGHVLSQRKELLGQILEGKAQKEELSFWNEQLVALTLRLGQMRKNFLDFLEHNFHEVYKGLTGFDNKFEIEYKTYATEKIGEDLKSHEEAEIRSGQNLIGPHREDFLVKKNGNINLHNSSRGELRSQILAIKLLQAEYLDQHHLPPIVLLDDVFSELDELRRIKLLESLSGHQIFITTTEEHHLPEIKNAQILKVENGQLVNS